MTNLNLLYFASAVLSREQEDASKKKIIVRTQVPVTFKDIYIYIYRCYSHIRRGSQSVNRARARSRYPLDVLVGREDKDAIRWPTQLSAIRIVR